MNQTFILLRGKTFYFLTFLMFAACTSNTSTSEIATLSENGDFISNEKKINIAEFDSKINQMMEAEGIPGVSIAIIDKGALVYSHNYGYKSLNTKDKVDDNTIFEAASLSKPYFIYVVYKLVEDGRLDLDKPMYQYLKNPDLEYDPRSKLITPRMILGHNSGLENWQNYYDPNVLEIISEPGTKFIYSGEGYNYLEKVVSQILDEHYLEYMDRLVIKPMNLTRTFLKYKKRNPVNYAVGHKGLGGIVDKWKNEEGIASSGMHHTAKDFATFIATIFDRKHLTKASINDITERLTPMEDYRSWGGGFEVHYYENDTLIAHGGHNPGFTSFVFYSVVNQRGFVLSTNSERGLAILEALNKMTANLPIDPFLKSFYIDQYPSDVPKFLKVYNEKGSGAAIAAVHQAEKENPGGLREVTLNEMADIFSKVRTEVARIPLQYCLQNYPNSSYAHFLLGNINERTQNFEVSTKNLTRAKELNYFFYPIEKTIELNIENLADAQQKENLPIFEVKDKITIDAEDYTEMKGVNTMYMDEKEEDLFVCYINKKNWIEYKINVITSGAYKINFRIVSDNWENTQVHILSEETLLADCELPIVGSWEDWETFPCEVVLPQGIQTFRLEFVRGYLDLDWIEFVRIKQDDINKSET